MARQRKETHKPAEPEQPAAVAVAEPPVEVPPEPAADDEPEQPAVQGETPGWRGWQPTAMNPTKPVTVHGRSNGVKLVLTLVRVDGPEQAGKARQAARELEARVEAKVRALLPAGQLEAYQALRRQLTEAQAKASQAAAERLTRLAALDGERQALEAGDMVDDLAAKLLAIEDRAAEIRGQGDAGQRAIDTLRRLLETRRAGLENTIATLRRQVEVEETTAIAARRAAALAKLDPATLDELVSVEDQWQHLRMPMGTGSVYALLGVP